MATTLLSKEYLSINQRNLSMVRAERMVTLCVDSWTNTANRSVVVCTAVLESSRKEVIVDVTDASNERHTKEFWRGMLSRARAALDLMDHGLTRYLSVPCFPLCRLPAPCRGPSWSRQGGGHYDG